MARSATELRVTLAVVAGLALVVAPRTTVAQAPPCTEGIKLTAGNGTAGDLFGIQRGVAASGDTVAVTARTDGATGSVYVFVRDGETWIQQAELSPSAAAAGDYFGEELALNGDRLVAGAIHDDDAGTNSGSVWVFERTGSSWTEQAQLMADDAAAGDVFGAGVALDGETIFVGAPVLAGYNPGSGFGAVYEFELVDETWTQQARLAPDTPVDGDGFGVRIAASGDTIVVGAPQDPHEGQFTGAAYVFVRDGATWTQQARLIAEDADRNDWFGWDVAIHEDTVMVGCMGSPGYRWGSVYVFERDGETWTQQDKLMAGDGVEGDHFGIQIGMSGDLLAVGAPGDDGWTGSGYVFVRSGTTWTELAKLTASDRAVSDRFGYSADVGSGTFIFGADGDDDLGLRSGSAHAFDCLFSLGDVIEIVEALPRASVTTSGNQTALGNFIAQAVEALQAGDVAGAVDKLEKSLNRTDGCVLRGAVDARGSGRDWVTDCLAQEDVYWPLRRTLDALQ